LIFVDSSVWIDYFNGRPTRQVRVLDGLLGREPLVIGDIVLAEVLQGFRKDRDYRIARDLLAAFEIRNVLDMNIALQSAQHFRSLRKKGVTVRKTVDAIIATFCIASGLYLLHSDRDFDAFEKHLGLRVVH
jgi:predicted nucleic acid-binding protein